MKPLASPISHVLLATLGASLLLVLFFTTALTGQEQKPAAASDNAADGPESRLTADQPAQLAQAQQLHDDAVALYQETKYREAREKFAESLRIRTELLGEDDLQTASSMSWLAYVFRTTGDYAQAEKYYRQALAVNEKVLGDEHAETATSLNNLAFVYTKLGDDFKAKSLYERALTIREKVLGPNHTSTAVSLNNLASVYRSLGSYAKAKPLYDRALEIRTELLGENDPSVAGILNNLAVLQTWMGNYDQAQRLYERSLKLIRQVRGDDHPETATCLYNLGLLATMAGDYHQAEAKYTEALAIFQQSLGEDHPVTAQIQGGLALLFAAMGETAKAQPLYEQSLDTTTEVLGAEHPVTVRIRGNLGLLHHSLGDYDKAAELYEDCLKIRIKVLGEQHSETAASHLNLGRLYQDRGDVEKAESHFERALAIHQQVLGDHHSETAASLDNLGLLMLTLGRHDEAAKRISQSLAIRRELLEATANVQSERQQLLMNQHVRSTLDDWLSLPAVANESAYAEVLRWKGAVFVRQAALRVLRQQPELESLVEQLRAVSSQLAKFALDTPPADQQASYQDRLRQLSDERQQLEVELSRKSQPHRQANQLAKLTPAELQKILPEKTALVDMLEYDRFLPPPLGERTKARRERQFVAFVVRPDREGIQRVELGSAKMIDELVDDWHKKCRDTENSALKKPAQDLYRRLWLPLEPHLDGVETVLISPDGSLGKLPFAALPAGTKSESYLLEKIAVVTIPVPQSVLALLGPNTSKRPEFDMLVMGGIKYGDASEPSVDTSTTASPKFGGRGGARRSWKFLPGSAGEGLDVQNKFQLARPQGSVKFLQQSAPTEELIKELAPQYRYLHFATHGYFAPPELRSALDTRRDTEGRGGSTSEDLGQFLGLPSGALSGLALAGANQPGEGEDGTLTALEVDGLDLSKTSLVVLSACETGLGRVAGGEGVLGLQRSFQLAGARSVVATLWEVNDSKTRDLMGKFYKNYWAGELSTTECLRQAQLELLKLPPDRGTRLGNKEEKVKAPRLQPKYWAAFVLSGDWQ